MHAFDSANNKRATVSVATEAVSCRRSRFRQVREFLLVIEHWLPVASPVTGKNHFPVLFISSSSKVGYGIRFERVT